MAGMVYMQVIISWRSLHGGWLQRVVSRRMSSTGSLQTVITGTHWTTAAVLAGKQWVKQAQATGAAHNRRAAQQLRKLIGQYSLHMYSYAHTRAVGVNPEMEPLVLLITVCVWTLYVHVHGHEFMCRLPRFLS